MLRRLRLLVLPAIVIGLAVSGSWSHRVSGQAAPVADEFASLHFRSIGPATMSGRITDFAVYEANPAIYYVASAHGGVWKTTSGGAMYEPQLQDMGTMSIGDVTVSQKDPNLVWVGKGESNNRQSLSWGDGVYKSTDGGKTWRHMGLRESKHINRIVIDPVDNNIVFVAATGPLWGPGGERGVYKTTDGGSTWKLVLKGANEFTGANDLVMAATDRNILYASMYQRQRSQCCFNGGGPGAGIWKSTDHGETWTKLSPIPSGNMGRIALDVYRSSANLVYALIEAEAAPGAGGGDAAQAAGGRGGRGAAGAAAAGGGRGAGAPDPAQAGGGRGGAGGGGGQSGLYRSDDGGTTWRRVNPTNPRPMYFSQVRVDPVNPDRVYMGGVGLHLTPDGGRTMSTDAALVTHDDVHAIWINPANPNHVMIGHDGGVSVSLDASRTWTQHNNLPLALFYHVSVDMAVPYNVCGGLQDNYNWCGPSAVRFSRGIANSDWYQVQGGDGFVVLQDPRDSRYVYSESQDGNIQRRNRVTGEARNIRPNFQNTSPAPAEGALPFRWNWDTPIVFSPHDTGALLSAANKVFRSNDRGDSWAVISPDLTTNTDRNELEIMGVRNTQVTLSRNDGISAWPTIVSLAESPKQAGLYFTGTDDGVVSMSKDGGKTWDRITDRLPGFPKWGYVSEVVPSRFDANTVYVTVDAHRENDYNTHIWASTDMGATFRSLSANLKGEVVRTLLEDTKNADVLYVGTDTGIFLTIDRGKSWRRLKGRNFPDVRVDEMVIHPRDNALVVGTHGRGVWILDRLEPIQEYAAAQAASTADAKLFTIPAAVQFRTWDNQNDEFWGHHFFLGENPPADAVIQYHLKKPVTDLKFKIVDAAGREIRELTPAANRNVAGIQTICWDMRVAPIPPPAGGAAAAAAAAAGRAGGAGGGAGRGGGAPATGPLAGIPTPLPDSGYMPFNPCGGGGFGGGGFGGGGGNAGPLVYPGTYTVQMIVAGKVVESKAMRVSADPSVQMNDLQAKRYYDITLDLHDMQRRGTEMAAALTSMYTQMQELGAKVPASAKAQFDAANKELDAVRVKFGVPPQAGGGGGGRGGGGGGFGGGGGAADPANVLARAGNVKALIMAFQDNPSDTAIRQYNDVKATLPKAILEGNAFLVKAMSLSQTLKTQNLTLTVPAPVK
jgi:photosystem II stability/assembly factor-like uncharacterized protein